MKKKFKLNAEFLLPQDFNGGFNEAFELFVEHCKKEWDKQDIPSNIPENKCFEYILDRTEGKLYTTYSIELFEFNSFDEEMAYNDWLEEEEFNNNLSIIEEENLSQDN